MELRGFTTRFLDLETVELCPVQPDGVSRRVELAPLGELEVVVESTAGQRLSGVEVWVGIEAARFSAGDVRKVVSVKHLEHSRWTPSRLRMQRVDHAAYIGDTDAEGRIAAREVPRDTELFVVVRSDNVLERRSLRLGRAHVRLVVRAEGGRHLSGRILWDDGVPLAGAWIELFDGQMVEQRNLTAEGRYEFHRVRSGRVKLALRAPVPLGAVIDVDACEGQAEDLLVPRRVTVRGRLLCDEEARTSWWLEAWQGSRCEGSAAVTTAGTFEILVPAGPTCLLFRSSWSWPAPVGARIELEAPAEGVVVDVRERFATVRLRVPDLAAGAEVSIREYVEPERNQGFHKAESWERRSQRVQEGGFIVRHHVPQGRRAWLIDAGERGAAWTGLLEVPEEGSIEIGPLPLGFGWVVREPAPESGEFLLVSPLFARKLIPSIGDGHPWETRVPAGPWACIPSVVAAHMEEAEWFDVIPGSRYVVEGARTQLAKVSGSVHMGSVPIAEHRVQIRHGALISQVAKDLRSRTDDQGRFAFTSVLAGRYWITLWDPDERFLGLEQVEVEGGADVHVEFQLGAAEASLLVAFRNGDEPLRGVNRVDVVGWEGMSVRSCRRISRQDGEHWRVSGVAGRALFGLRTAETLHAGGGRLTSLLFAEAVLASEQEVVQLCEGILEVELPHDAGIPAPVAYLIEVDGLPARLLDYGRPPVLVRDETEGRLVRYRSVPARSSIELHGFDREGWPRIQSVNMGDALRRRVTWSP